MAYRDFDFVISLDEINNLEGPYIEITTGIANYNLKIKKTFITDLIVVDNKVCDFNKSEGFWFGDGTVIFIVDREVYYGK